MAHTALYGGTVYEKKGGADLVGGTVYKKDHGKVLVGGTAYEVGFGGDMATVRLMSDTFVDYNYVSAYIDYTTPNGDHGSLYTAGEYELPIGTAMLFNLKYGGKDRVDMYITLNDESVASGDMGAFYKYTLTGNITIDFYNGYYNGGAIYITEE